jgi:hypothetical protein
MKITQAQLRVIKSMLMAKATAACKLQTDLAAKFELTNNAKIEAAAQKILKKYEKRLVKSIRPDITAIQRGWGAECAVQFDAVAMKEFAEEVKATIDTLPTVGSTYTTQVAFPALGLTHDYGRREDTRKLEVPHCEVEKWQDLARSIDESFMTGDANKLAWLIGEFK